MRERESDQQPWKEEKAKGRGGGEPASRFRSDRTEINMKLFVVPVVLLIVFKLSEGVPLRLQKRAAFYIANETACVVDDQVYLNGDPIVTDDPCESCYCRPPGFACALTDCKSQCDPPCFQGCRQVKKPGVCCPEYICDSNNSTEAGLVSSTETAFSFEKTTISTQASETMPSEAPEITSTPETKAEEDADPSDLIKPENLDPLALFL
ncbi:VWFC domain-containing protein [Caerostris darwini]|uniref:VWFC domain-containing protein n=1 Tax=Caerostris darwini TaxID=1538125 RepID=A0AAV4T5V2_9ARAC|nr:VWFC domain-containing protein [Caerostris darwini]